MYRRGNKGSNSSQESFNEGVAVKGRRSEGLSLGIGHKMVRKHAGNSQGEVKKQSGNSRKAVWE